MKKVEDPQVSVNSAISACAQSGSLQIAVAWAEKAELWLILSLKVRQLFLQEPEPSQWFRANGPSPKHPETKIDVSEDGMLRTATKFCWSKIFWEGYILMWWFQRVSYCLSEFWFHFKRSIGKWGQTPNWLRSSRSSRWHHSTTLVPRFGSSESPRNAQEWTEKINKTYDTFIFFGSLCDPWIAGSSWRRHPGIFIIESWPGPPGCFGLPKLGDDFNIAQVKLLECMSQLLGFFTGWYGMDVSEIEVYHSYIYIIYIYT